MRKINITRIFVNELETQDEKNNSGAAKPRISTIQKTKLDTKQKHSYTPDAVVVPCSLTCNPTRTLPNQVSYLKGSSMESFTLGPTLKIDFSCSAATTHLQWLQRGRIITNNFHKILSELWRNSIPNSCSSQCPGASINRPRVQMGDCSNMYGRRPDGEPESSGRTTVRPEFLRFSLKIFPV
jgi:hypothetical protein